MTVYFFTQQNAQTSVLPFFGSKKIVIIIYVLRQPLRLRHAQRNVSPVCIALNVVAHMRDPVCIQLQIIPGNICSGFVQNIFLHPLAHTPVCLDLVAHVSGQRIFYKPLDLFQAGQNRALSCLHLRIFLVSDMASFACRQIFRKVVLRQITAVCPALHGLGLCSRRQQHAARLDSFRLLCYICIKGRTLQQCVLDVVLRAGFTGIADCWPVLSFFFP